MKELYKALLKIQGELKPVKRTSENPFFKSHYADLEAVVEAVVPLLTKYGIIASQTTRININGLVELVTSLIHAESGEKIESISPIIVKDATNPQTFIAATTYARRSSLTTICGLATMDDDGNAAAANPATPANHPERKGPQPATATAQPTIAELEALRQKKAEEFRKANLVGLNGTLGKTPATIPAKPTPPPPLTTTGYIKGMSKPNNGGYVKIAIKGDIDEEGKDLPFTTKDPLIIETLADHMTQGELVGIEYRIVKNGRWTNYNIVGLVAVQEPAEAQPGD